MVGLPKKSEGKVALAILAVFALALHLPFVSFANNPTLTLGVSTLWLYAVAWGVLAIVVLVWAAWTDAFGLTQDQVPPELRDGDDATGSDP